MGEGSVLMSLSHLVGLLERRWLVVVLGLIVTIGAAVAAWSVVPSDYSTTSTMLLLPPVNRTEPGANPYLSLAGLTGPAEVVARSVNDPATELSLRQAGASGTWTVDRDYQTSAPIILITAQGTSIENTRATTDLILAEVPKALDGLQASINVPPTARITSTVVNRDADVQRVLKPLIRVLMFVVVAGLALTVALAALIDSVMLRRRSGESGPRGRRRLSSDTDGLTWWSARSPSGLPTVDGPQGDHHARPRPRRRVRPQAPGPVKTEASEDVTANGESALISYAAHDVHVG